MQNATPTALATPISFVDEDERLLYLIKERNDYGAFTQLFKKYYNYLCEQSYCIVKCEQKAEEIVADLFYKLWKRRDSIKVATKVKCYLHASVRNRTIDHLRKYRREKNFSDVELPEYISHFTSPDDYAIGEDCRERIRRAVNKLPPKGRQVFLLSRDEGLKYREIAEQLQLSVKTVETHIRRSLIFLRSELHPELGEFV